MNRKEMEHNKRKEENMLRKTEETDNYQQMVCWVPLCPEVKSAKGNFVFPSLEIF